MRAIEEQCEKLHIDEGGYRSFRCDVMPLATTFLTTSFSREGENSTLELLQEDALLIYSFENLV